MKKLILIRHGESESNVDKTILNSKSNCNVELTKNGRIQADEAGANILKYSQYDKSAHFIISPYLRTRQTYKGLTTHIKPLSTVEDIRLREIDVGNYITDFESIRRERSSYSKMFYRFPNGESAADVVLRLQSWMNDKPFEGYPDDCTIIVVTHAMTMRCFQFIKENLTVEQFEDLPKPKNCGTLCYAI